MDVFGTITNAVYFARALVDIVQAFKESKADFDDFKSLVWQGQALIDSLRIRYEESIDTVKLRCKPEYDKIFCHEGTAEQCKRHLQQLQEQLSTLRYQDRALWFVRRQQVLATLSKIEICTMDFSRLLHVMSHSVMEGVHALAEKSVDLAEAIKGMDKELLMLSQEAAKVRERMCDTTERTLILAQTNHQDQCKLLYETERKELKELYDRLSEISWKSITKRLDDDMAICQRYKSLPQWILDDSRFLEWANANNTTWSKATLWGIGSLGVGKSMIASCIATWIKNKLVLQTGHVSVAVHYFSHKTKDTQPLDDVIRSLARQIIEQRPDKSGEEKTEKRNLLQQIELYTKLPDTFLQKTSSGGQTFLVLDALDECRDPDAVVRRLYDIHSACPRVHVFFTTRPNQPILQDIDLVSTRINITPRTENLASYVESRIHVLTKSSALRRTALARISQQPDRLRVLVKQLVHSANHVFLFAEKHVNALVECRTEAQLVKGLQNPRLDLEDLFDDALRRIRDQTPKYNASLGERALKWVVHAKRSLKTKELSHALAMYDVPPGEDLDHDSLPNGTDIIECSSNLLQITGNVVRLHPGFQQYCELNRQRHFPGADAEIAQICIRYFSLPRFLTGHTRSEDEWKGRKSRSPFLFYAAAHWGYHVKAVAGNSIHETSHEVLSFMGSLVQLQCAGQAAQATRFFFLHFDDPINWKAFSEDEPIVPALHLAAYFGLEKTVQHLLKSGYDVNGRSVLDMTALNIAVMKGSYDMCVFLLDRGADPNYRNRYNQSCLHHAAWMGNLRIVELLLQRGAGSMINRTNWSHSTALNDAASSSDTMKMILKYGADPTIPNALGNTPLHSLAFYDHVDGADLVKKILELKPSLLNVLNNKKESPLHVAVLYSRHHIMQALLKHGADPLIGSPCLVTAVSRNDIKATDILLTSSERIAYQQGSEALLQAYQKRNSGMFHQLLDAGADVSAAIHGADESSLLHRAASDCFPIFVRMIVNQRPDLIDTQDCRGLTPLGRALSDGPDPAECVEYLLATGADPSRQKADGTTQVHKISKAIHFDLYKRLFGLCGHDGNSLPTTNMEIEPPLHHAIRNYLTDIVVKLVEENAHLLQNVDKEGKTAFMCAAESGNDEIVQKLAAMGADVKAVDFRGRTAIHWATRYPSASDNTLDCLQAVIDCCAQEPSIDIINMSDARKETALHTVVVRWNSQRNFEKLLLNGADPLAKTSSGETILHLSCGRLESFGTTGKANQHLARFATVVKHCLGHADRNQLLFEPDDLHNTFLHIIAADNWFEAAALVMSEVDNHLKQRLLWMKRIDGKVARDLAGGQFDWRTFDLLDKEMIRLGPPPTLADDS